MSAFLTLTTLYISLCAFGLVSAATLAYLKLRHRTITFGTVDTWFFQIDLAVPAKTTKRYGVPPTANTFVVRAILDALSHELDPKGQDVDPVPVFVEYVAEASECPLIEIRRGRFDSCYHVIVRDSDELPQSLMWALNTIMAMQLRLPEDVSLELLSRLQTKFSGLLQQWVHERAAMRLPKSGITGAMAHVSYGSVASNEDADEE